jgi:hypothetical protein
MWALSEGWQDADMVGGTPPTSATPAAAAGAGAGRPSLLLVQQVDMAPAQAVALPSHQARQLQDTGATCACMVRVVN